MDSNNNTHNNNNTSFQDDDDDDVIAAPAPAVAAVAADNDDHDPLTSKMQSSAYHAMDDDDDDDSDGDDHGDGDGVVAAAAASKDKIGGYGTIIHHHHPARSTTNIDSSPLSSSAAVLGNNNNTSSSSGNSSGVTTPSFFSDRSRKSAFHRQGVEMSESVGLLSAAAASAAANTGNSSDDDDGGGGGNVSPIMMDDSGYGDATENKRHGKHATLLQFLARSKRFLEFSKIFFIMVVFVFGFAWYSLVQDDEGGEEGGGGLKAMTATGFRFYALSAKRPVRLVLDNAQPRQLAHLRLQLVSYDEEEQLLPESPVIKQLSDLAAASANANDYDDGHLNSFGHDLYVSVDYNAVFTKRQRSESGGDDKVEIAGTLTMSHRDVAVNNLTEVADMEFETRWDMISEWEKEYRDQLISDDDSDKIEVGLDHLMLVMQLNSTSSWQQQGDSAEYAVAPVQIKMTQHTDMYRIRLVIAFVLLVFVYILIIFELVERTVCTMLGAMLTVSAMAMVNMKPALPEVINYIEFHTLLLLFGMMVIVAIFSTTGFFEWVALKACKVSRNNVWLLTVILCIFTAVSASMLDNVTTTLLLAPVIVRLSQVVDISPIPILMSTVLVSNVGGCATAVGDPPVVLIVNTPKIKAAGIGFNEILFFMAPGTIVMVAVAICMLRYLYHSDFKRKAKQLTTDEIRLMKEIEIWKDTAKRLSNDIQGEQAVKDMIQSHVTELNSQLTEHSKNNRSDEEKVLNNIKQLENEYRITNKYLFVVCSIVLLVVILLFFTENFMPFVHMSMDSIALSGAIVVLILSNTKHIEYVLEKVEWSTLIFFGCLFIIMGGISDLGLMDFVGGIVSDLIIGVSPEWRMPIAITVIVWLSAILSAIIDSIPYTTSMIPIVIYLSESLDLPLKPLVFAMAFGTGLGGNGTAIASTANIIVLGIAAKNGHPISFWSFSRKGIPIMLTTVFMANVYLLVVHCVFGLGMS